MRRGLGGGGEDAEGRARRVEELRGAVRLIGEGVEAAATVVQDMHRAIQAAPLELLEAKAGAAGVRRGIEGVRDGVYSAVRGVSRLLFRVADAVIERGGLAPERPLPGPLLGAVQGVVGDHLARGGSPLHIAMQLRRGGQALELTREGLAGLGPRVAVFVHGLACDESCWERGAARGRVDFAALLAERHGYAPVFVRYNSGRRIAESGRDLAALLTALFEAHPDGVTRLALIGHSMGGLVATSAAHHGHAAGAAWVDALRDVVCLGSPQLGAPLEQFGAVAAAVLSAVGVTAPIARVIDARSAGIKDLRKGDIVDGGPVQRPPRTRYHSVAGAIGGPRHPIGWALGDGMVRVRSAHAGEPDRQHIPGLHHMDLLDHPAVFAAIEAALAD